MDENIGMDPEVRRYFRKILSSFGAAILWLMTVGTAGFYFHLAIIKESVQWYNAVFYGVFAGSLCLLIFYFYKLWQRKEPL